MRVKAYRISRGLLSAHLAFFENLIQCVAFNNDLHSISNICVVNVVLSPTPYAMGHYINTIIKITVSWINWYVMNCGVIGL